MPFTQENRKIGIETPLGADVVLLVGLSGREAISELFSFQLELVAENRTNVAFERLLGQKVTAQIEKARSEPKNFEAQIKAAELYYQIRRYDPAIEFLLKANQLKPDDYQTLGALGLVNLDAGHYDVAEKWYRAALLKKSDDVVTLAGLAAATLGKGDAKAAEQAIANLEKVDPTSEDLPQFKEKLASLKKQ